MSRVTLAFSAIFLVAARPAKVEPPPVAPAAAVAVSPPPVPTPRGAPVGSRPPGDPAIGATKIAACAGCHGLDGNSVNTLWPKLAEQSESYIVKELEDFRSGARKDPMMSAMAAALPEEDIAHVAAYFASQGRKRDTVKVLSLASEGHDLYQWGRPADGIVPCAGCHGSKGHGYVGMRPGGFPAIGGQHADYIEKQLKAFRAGDRTNDVQGVMGSVASRLTDKDIWALAQYTSGLQY